MFTLILTAAGSSSRARQNKILFNLNGKTVLENALAPFLANENISEVLITASATDFNEISLIAEKYTNKPITVITGGKTRFHSVFNALQLVKTDYVIVHDGARPFVSAQLVDDAITSAKQFGSGVASIASPDTVARAENGIITESIGKNNVFIIQTPQAFETVLIKQAYLKAAETDKDFGDESSVYRAFIGEPHISEGSRYNTKLTYPEDLMPPYRVGTGFDCHELRENRKLILGGVTVPNDKGLYGHSDADALAHAVMDAVLSALGLPDIGHLFPDTDEKYKDCDSMLLLKEVACKIFEQGLRPVSLSAVIMAEKPKLAPYVDAMRKNIAAAMRLSESSVGISCTTLEGLGFVGREEGICTRAEVILVRN